LWLPAPVAARLAGHSDLDRLRKALDAHGLEVVTLNAFPYAAFHAPQVKKAVYRPDWFEEKRLDYTLDCATVLARLMPDDARRGAISTLPLGWRAPWYADRQHRAREHLDRLADGLAAIEASEDRTIRVGLEPEPGCVVETVDDALERLAGVDTERLGICLDACHLAVQFEDPESAVRRLDAAGLPIVKVQASAALQLTRPDDPAQRTGLAEYAEDRFLHQVRELAGGRIIARDDLPDALDGPRPLPGRGPWRVHFHVPVHVSPEPPLESTSDHLGATLGAVLGGGDPKADVVEVETYTWSVLPARLRPETPEELADGLAAELSWTARQMIDTGLEAA
jgi:hypothetical protein